MPLQSELKIVLQNVYLQLEEMNLTSQQKKCIEKALSQSYDSGYEEGLMDGKEITENPISG